MSWRCLKKEKNCVIMIEQISGYGHIASFCKKGFKDVRFRFELNARSGASDRKRRFSGEKILVCSHGRRR